ncbi:S41 family peptidase [Patescibacteria group bacterium]|nr:S41 family peptidase [Patescibacteria group bacterium]MCG2694637.1 S41 family peptidase [Candidatus Parcubacteria bacterium]
MTQKKIIKKIISPISALLLIIIIFFAGFYSGQNNAVNKNEIDSLINKENDISNKVDFSPFWEAWNVLQEKYVGNEEVSDQDKVWGAIQGLASSVNDPYTIFMPPSDAEMFEDDISGNFSGVGMEIGIQDNILTVIAPLKETPAEKAGIKAGDKIIKIDGVSTIDFGTDKAVKMIRGESGTPVILSISREGENEIFEITIVRGNINIPTIKTEIKDNVFVIRLYSFSAVSPELFREALKEFIEFDQETGSGKLILDLRGNPGGYMEAAIDMASWFLPLGKTVVIENFGKDKKETVHRSRGYDIFNKNLKFAILVDGGSASASEILAGALQEHKIATIVGTKTFGKGSVQELVKITPDTALKVTVARWLTPNGNSISKNGLDPDVEVKISAEDLENGEDPQLEKAIEILNTSE